MKKFTLPLMLVVFSMFSLVACGDEKPKEQPPVKTEKTKAGKAKFLAKVTGEITEELIGKPWVFCGKSSLTHILGKPVNELDLTLLKKPQQFSLKIPLPIKVDTVYPIFGEKNSESLKLGVARMYYKGSDKKLYQQNVSGELKLSAIPEKEGDSFAGTLKATAADKKDLSKIIQIEATFDFLAGSQSFDDCK